MATRVAPTRIDAVNSSGRTVARNRLAVCTDWRAVGRFHVGTGRTEPTIDAGYTTACVIQQPNLSISFLAFRGSPYTDCYAALGVPGGLNPLGRVTAPAQWRP